MSESYRGGRRAQDGPLDGVERARQYFRHRPACFPIQAAPDRVLHRAYDGLPVLDRALEIRAETERDAVQTSATSVCRRRPDAETFATVGFHMTPEDEAESTRPLLFAVQRAEQ
jgi:hypothetical protein